MALTAGARLGAYEIIGLLGAGGPPPLTVKIRELRRDLAVANQATT
jgi:hypothetical protein